jgi:hypothetical protein
MGEGAVNGAETRYRQAAWTYVAYGVVYWLGGLALAQSGLGPRGMERGGSPWFVVGALFVVVFPWSLMRARPWFERWILSRRDFARVLALVVGFRALEVARIGLAPRAETVSVLGLDLSMRGGAWAFCALAVVTAAMLARAAWSREA